MLYRKKGLVFACFLFLASCTPSLIVSGMEAEENLYFLTRVTLNMPANEVLRIMGSPKCARRFSIEGEDYEVWYYLTTPYATGQMRPIPKNFTPLIFKDAELVGFGYIYLRHITKDPRFLRQKIYHETRPPIEGELRTTEHGLVSPPPYEKRDEAHLRDPQSTAVRRKRRFVAPPQNPEIEGELSEDEST